MGEISFYHLTARRLEDALPQLLEKCLERGWKAVVAAGSEERVEALNRHLWTYRDRTFLPHGSTVDGDAAYQPVWLTDRIENPNGASVLFLTDGAEGGADAADGPDGFTLVCDLFDGTDDASVQAARQRWRTCAGAGHALTYWQQAETGRWEQKASAGKDD